MNKLFFYNPLTIRRLTNHVKSVYYIGINYRVKNKLNKKGINQIDISNLLSKVADEIKYDFINYITSIGRMQNNQLIWWATRIASKNNSQTDFFSILCFIISVKKLIESNKFAVFLTNDPRIYFTLKNNFNLQNTTLSTISATALFFLQIVTKILKNPISKLIWIFKTFYKNIKFKKILNKTDQKGNFIYSWVENRSFSKGYYDDPYLPGIDYYKSSIPYIVFVPYYVNSCLYVKLKSANKMFSGLPIFSNWLVILKSIFFILKINYNISYKNLEISYLWLYEILRENCSSHFTQQIHDYFCWEKFFRSNKGRLIYPYESQPWEKMMILAARSESSKMELIGYQHSTVGKNILNYHTTAEELFLIPLPDLIVVNSTFNKEMFERQYKNSEVKIINGGALRYMEKVKLTVTVKTKKILGIMLPVDKNQAFELLDHIINIGERKFDIVVKSHPDLSINKRHYLNRIQFFQGSAIELYRIADGVVYCYSTAGLEAYSYGLPVFRYSGNFIDLQMGEYMFSPKIIRSLDEISENELFLHQPKKVFSPVDHSVWESLLN